MADPQREIERLERRIAELEHPDTSGLTEIVSPTEAELVELAENFLGRGLDPIQAYHLGRMIGAFGPQRAKQALLASRFKQDPIRYAYALVVNRGKYGKPMPQKGAEVTEVKYWCPPEDYDPWAK